MFRLGRFWTPSGKIVQVLEEYDIPTAQGDGAALVQSDFDSKPWMCEMCLLVPISGNKPRRRTETDRQA